MTDYEMAKDRHVLIDLNVWVLPKEMQSDLDEWMNSKGFYNYSIWWQDSMGTDEAFRANCCDEKHFTEDAWNELYNFIEGYRA